VGAERGALKISVSIAILLCALASVAQAQSPKDEGAIQIVRRGARPALQAPAEHFTGSVRVDPLFQATARRRVRQALSSRSNLARVPHGTLTL